MNWKKEGMINGRIISNNNQMGGWIDGWMDTQSKECARWIGR